MLGVGDPVRARAQLEDARLAVDDAGIGHAQRASPFLQFHDQIKDRRHVALVPRSPKSFHIDSNGFVHPSRSRSRRPPAPGECNIYVTFHTCGRGTFDRPWRLAIRGHERRREDLDLAASGGVTRRASRPQADWPQRGEGSPASTVRQAAPSGPSRSSAARWETNSDTSTRARSTSLRATRRKWWAASSSSKTTSTAGRTRGRRWGAARRSSAGRARGAPPWWRAARRGAPTPGRTATASLPGGGRRRRRGGRSAGGRCSGRTATPGGAGRAAPPPIPRSAPVSPAPPRSGARRRCARGCAATGGCAGRGRRAR